MGLRILIVDDEEPAREELTYMLSERKEIQLIEQATNGFEAIRKAKENNFDLIFLDIELPDLKGIQVSKVLTELDTNAHIVFVTAFDQYAVEAFKLRAFHYILKPYDEEDLDLVFQQLQKQKRNIQIQTPSALKLAIDVEGGIKYLSPKDVVYISKNKEEKSVTIHTTSKKYEAQHTLMELEKKLAQHNFFRIHKSFLVNLEYVLELQTYHHSTYNLYLNDQEKTIVPVSRNYVKELRSRLEI